MARRVRIGVSVFFAVLTVVLCMLWVRSYSYYEGVRSARRSHVEQIAYLAGAISICSDRVTLDPEDRGLSIISENRLAIRRFAVGSGNYVWTSNPERLWLVVPFWAPTLLCSTIAVVPWLRCRFSLRMLFIASTLVAVLLGLIMWFAL